MQAAPAIPRPARTRIVVSDIHFLGLGTLKPLLESPVDEFWLDFKDKAAPVPALIRILPRGGPFTVTGVETEGAKQRLSPVGPGSAQISAFLLAAVNTYNGVERWLCEDTEPDEDTASFRFPLSGSCEWTVMDVYCALLGYSRCVPGGHQWNIIRFKKTEIPLNNDHCGSRDFT